MNKAVVAVIVVLLLLGSVGGYLYLNSKNQDKDIVTTSQESNSQTQSTDDKRFQGSLSDLLTLGENYTCAFTSKDDTNAQTAGKVYVLAKGEKVRGEFVNTQANGQKLSTNMIYDGEYNYMWDPSTNEGFKMKIDKQQVSDIFQNPNQGGTDAKAQIDNNVEFNCSKWSEDTNLFVIPSNVKFSDFSSMMQDSTQNIKVDCSVCDQVPAGAAQEQCKTSLGC